VLSLNNGGCQTIEQELIDTAAQLADISGEIIRGYYRRSFQTEFKEAASPIVTIADRQAEEALRRFVETKFPDHGIIGEEFGHKPAKSRYTWIFDPIDGTIAFSTGKPLFGTLISLLVDEQFAIGVLDQPVTSERWLGVRGRPTLFNGQQIKTKSNEDLAKASLSTTTPYMFEEPSLRQSFEALRKRVHVVSFGGDCYQYGLLASGFIDIVMENGLQLHDFAALVPIIEGAGGVITSLAGEPLTNKSPGDVLVCGNQSLHRQAVEILRSSQ
jgi:histidinol phosphatase-like enzyme (inositol monophosphatase family)